MIKEVKPWMNYMNDESIKNENIKNDKEVNITNEINDEILNNDDNFKTALNDIKDNEQNKYIEQINNMVDDIFKKTDKEIYSSINMKYLLIIKTKKIIITK